MVYYYPELGFSYLKLSFSEWLNIAEPALFDIYSDHEDNNWLFLHSAAHLPNYTAQVMLLSVDNTLYKLDGKYKKQLWLSNQAAPPEYVVAQVFEIQDSQFTELNSQALDHLRSRMSPQDLVKSIYNELGILFTSERLKSGSINEAMNIALRGKHRVSQMKKIDLEKEEINMKKAIGVFRGELLQIDKLNPNPDIFVSGTLAGTLIMLGLNQNNEKVKEFLVCLNDQNGQTLGDTFDPILLTLKAIEKYRASSDSTSKRQFSIYVCQIFIQAVTAWMEGKNSPNYWRKRVSSGADLMPYIKALKDKKGISEAKDL
jgi:hypothetical protein